MGPEGKADFTKEKSHFVSVTFNVLLLDNSPGASGESQPTTGQSSEKETKPRKNPSSLHGINKNPMRLCPVLTGDPGDRGPRSRAQDPKYEGLTPNMGIGVLLGCFD